MSFSACFLTIFLYTKWQTTKKRLLQALMGTAHRLWLGRFGSEPDFPNSGMLLNALPYYSIEN